MSFRRCSALFLLPGLCLLFGAGVAVADNLLSLSSVTFEELTSPAPGGSSEPTLAASGETVYLQWLESAESPALRVAAWQPTTGWGPVGTVAVDPRLFVNWADFPQLLALSDGTLASAWMRKSSAEAYDYDVFAATSADGGQSWGAPRKPHRDQKRGEHGFVSLVPNTAGTFNIVWLDGRNISEGKNGKTTGAMQLRTASWLPAGAFGDEVLLDARVCDCCQTAAAQTLEGLFVAYRDRSNGEVRDISAVRYDRGRWLGPNPVYADNWKISGCPVNGPAVSASKNDLGVAWFSDVNDAPEVKVALSTDGGVSFGKVVRVDGGNPLGRCDIEHLADGSFAVAWLEQAGESAQLRVRRVLADGTLEPPVNVTNTSMKREAGFPRLVFSGVSLFVAWTDVAQSPSTVRVARFDWSRPR